jgi:hypothetical protein
MQTGSFEKMSGAVEVDETYVGGKARFMHRTKRANSRQLNKCSYKLLSFLYFIDNFLASQP